MYKIIFVFLAIMGIATASCAQQKQGANRKQPNNKVFIAYFSATGTTAGAAEKLSKVTGGELYEITPAQPYTNADLNWNNKQSRSSLEMNDPKSRPAIRKSSIDIADYDVIFVGYPIWWNLAPRITIHSSRAIQFEKQANHLVGHHREAVASLTVWQL